MDDYVTTNFSAGNRSAWYALRRTLPPWRFEENLAELVELCPQYDIDEIIVKVDTEEFSHGLPTVERIKDYQPKLFQIRNELAKIDVVFSINPWVTLGHRDFGRDCTGTFPDMTFMTGPDGTTCKACACPLCAGWRSYITELWQVYAEPEPAVIWVEDDIRTFNHRPVRFGCFCDAHLSRFSEKAGRRVAREELAAAILAPGAPHPYRKIWLDLQAEIMVETAAVLERAVHSVSPRTRLGLMSSDPPRHAAEGRDWPAFTKALAGPLELVSRPSMAIYRETSLRGLYESAHNLRLTRSCLPVDTIVETEVENIPFTQYSKSNQFTFLQMALSFAMGSHGVTMNLFDHAGTPMAADPTIGRMLADSKAFLNGIVQRCRDGGINRGIGILHHHRGSDTMVLEEDAEFPDLIQDGFGWRSVLESLGFGTTFESADVVALSGQTIRAYDDDEVRQLLSHGVLIDLGAARALIEMGFEALIGVSVKREFRLHENEPLAAEEFVDPEFTPQVDPTTAGEEVLGAYLTLSLPSIGSDGRAGELALRPGARILSRMVDADRIGRYPFLTIFENCLGGRIAIYPVDITEAGGAAFLHPFRQQQMHAVLKWLSKDRVPLFVEGGVYPLAFRYDCDTHITVGLFNLSLDDWPHAEIHLNVGDRQLTAVERLNKSGEWQQTEKIEFEQHAGKVTIRLNAPVSFSLPLLISLKWKN